MLIERRSAGRLAAAYFTKALVLLMRNGALDDIYLKFRNELYYCALAVTRRADLAEDAVQEAFFRLYRLGRRPLHLKAYVFRAVRNAACDQARKNSRQHLELNEWIFDTADGPAETASKNEWRRRASEALKALAEDEREVIVQHLFAELTFREIARVLELPKGTVASRYRRGIQKLRERLEEES